MVQKTIPDAMPPPTFPISIARESSYRTKVRSPSARVQGIQQRPVLYDVNRTDRTWFVQINTTRYTEVQAFLIERDGRRFVFQNAQYTCTQWRWQWYGTVGLWGFSAEFERSPAP